MITAWTDLIASKKFWTAILAVVTLIASKKGFEVDTETFWAISAVFISLIGAQGLTDHGKERPVADVPSAPVIAPPAAPVAPAGPTIAGAV